MHTDLLLALHAERHATFVADAQALRLIRQLPRRSLLQGIARHLPAPHPSRGNYRRGSRQPAPVACATC